MKKLISLCALLFMLALPTQAAAQVATAGNHLAFDEVSQLATDAGTASYNVYVDNAAVGVALAGVTCVPAAAPLVGATCTANLPPLTSGNHTLAVTQVIAGIESAQSAPLSVRVLVLVVPTTLRVVK